MQQGGTTRSQQSSVSAALAASSAAIMANSPAPPSGHSIADMAQRDLDAALQLLADRAQYITGANGAAIALRRRGKNDMLCRASTGSNVPGLGALLSTEFGLSGESVRTRQPMRCDDAARDARVNHDVCRQMGIASVVVMPVVNDDEVLGVFELFSGNVNAFGERDVSALQRLSGMVETAVRLARASEKVSAGLKEEEVAIPPISDSNSVAPTPELESRTHNSGIAPPVSPPATKEILENSKAPLAAQQTGIAVEPTAVLPTAHVASAAQTESSPANSGTGTPALAAVETRRPLFWSAALDVSGHAHAADADQSQVPPMLRNLRKCLACGFPVSSDRTLCVECEEKKWRGQLRTPKPVAASSGFSEARASSAAAAAPAKAMAPPAKERRDADPAIAPVPQTSTRLAPVTVSDLVAAQSRPSGLPTATAPDPGPILSSGLGTSESWFAANKYILGAVVVVAAVVLAILFLR